MKNMFKGAVLFDQPIGGWEVKNVADFSGMFQQAAAFNQPLDSWDIRNGPVMTSMFRQATSFNQPLSSWDTSGVAKVTCALLPLTPCAFCALSRHLPRAVFPAAPRTARMPTSRSTTALDPAHL